MGNRLGKSKSPAAKQTSQSSRSTNRTPSPPPPPPSPPVPSASPPVTSPESQSLSMEEMKKIYLAALKDVYKAQYDAVQPVPYIKDRLYCVDRVFVEGGIQVLAGNGRFFKQDESWRRLKSYKNIFTDSELRTTRRILEGEPGYGKSTLTLQLAYGWCNGVNDSPLYGVENLIVLKLRQMGNIKKIDRAIKMFLLSKEPRIRRIDINKIIESFSSTVIILDGYDEYPDRDNDAGNDVGKIIRYKKLQDVDVTLTTRYLPKDYSKSKTKRVKLTGFDEISRDEYIRKAVTGPNDEAAVDKIKRALKENALLDDLCQVPLFFVMFSHMTHESDIFQKFNTLTDFFMYMIKCFHDHQKNKSLDENTYPYMIRFETHYEELCQIAFEGLNKEQQQIMWERDVMCKRLGQALYAHYVAIGILVEESVFVAIDGQMKILVRFYHKLFCEWYASYILIDVVSEAKTTAELSRALRYLDPFDLQYLYRFACGINGSVGSKIIDYLKSRKDGDKFAILCILEKSGGVDDIKGTVSELCSKLVEIDKGHSKLLQRSTVQLLQIASSHDIPISKLYLEWSFSGFDGKDIRLESGLSLPSLSSVEKISINAGDKQEFTEEEVIGLVNYGIKSPRFKELWLKNCKLPSSIKPDIIPKESRSRNIKVISPNEARYLDLRSGQWRKPDDIQTITEMCSGSLIIHTDTSESVQRSVIELLVEASNHDIPIFEVSLNWSFSKIDEDGNIILSSGLSLPIMTSIENMNIQTEYGREMNKHEVNGLLNYVQHSQRFKELFLYDCLLPSSIPVAPSLSTLKSRRVNVCWFPDSVKYDEYYKLDLDSGLWEDAAQNRRSSNNCTVL
ncbi:uncharacterized protein [Apostichopus japonicus]|uniref:uncharacterized protein isoform X2 n=1 Tax=Stichopus japonicus TaxID=307972 RepID=UPI003AB691A5